MANDFKKFLKEGGTKVYTDPKEFWGDVVRRKRGGSSGEEVKQRKEAEQRIAEEKARQKILEEIRRVAEEKRRIEEQKERARKAGIALGVQKARDRSRAAKERGRERARAERELRERARKARVSAHVQRVREWAKELRERAKEKQTQKTLEKLREQRIRKGLREPTWKARAKPEEKGKLLKILEKFEKGREISRTELGSARKLYAEKVAEIERAVKGRKLSQAEINKLSREAGELSREVMRETFNLLKTTSGQRFIETAIGIKELPRAIKEIVKDKRNITKVGKGIVEDVTETAQLYKISPTEFVAKVGTDIITFQAIGGVLKVVGKLVPKVATKLSPKFRGIKHHKIIIPSKQPGKTLTIKIGGTVKKLAEPLKKQAKLAGKEVTAVSAQADKLLKFIRRKKIIRKPIPGEKGFSFKTKNLLKSFEKGTINKKNLIKLDNLIRKETRGAGSLLERSFFADPRGRLRPSRLGIRQKEASLLDVLSGDITFKTQKPQVLIFEKIKVQKFPKELRGIQKKLKAGKPLTRAEANKLLQFQLKKSGKFKPVGHLTKEPEITLAPGEIVKKGKTIAVTLIDGKRVPIVSAKIIKAKPLTKKLLIKAKKGKLTSSELRKLRSNLRKETGFKTSFSRGRIGKKVYPIKRKLISRALKRRPRRRVTRKPTRARPRPRPKPRRRVTRKPTRARPRPRPKPRRRVGRPAGKPTIIIKLKKVKRKRIRKKKVIKSYDVYARPLKRTKKGKRKKLIKVNRVPLTKKRAKDLRNYISDTSLSRTSRIKPTRGKPKKPKIRVPMGYSPRTRRKFRTHKIVKGKRRPLAKGKVIEKKGHILDTRQEKRGLTLRRRIAQLRKPVKRKRTTKRRPTFKQLKNLANARKKLALMRKRGK